MRHTNAFIHSSRLRFRSENIDHEAILQEEHVKIGENLQLQTIHRPKNSGERVRDSCYSLSLLVDDHASKTSDSGEHCAY